MAKGNSSAGGGSVSCSAGQTDNVATLPGGFRPSVERWSIIDQHISELDRASGVIEGIRLLALEIEHDPLGGAIGAIAAMCGQSLFAASVGLYEELKAIREESDHG